MGWHKYLWHNVRRHNAVTQNLVRHSLTTSDNSRTCDPIETASRLAVVAMTNESPSLRNLYRTPYHVIQSTVSCYTEHRIMLYRAPYHVIQNTVSCYTAHRIMLYRTPYHVIQNSVSCYTELRIMSVDQVKDFYRSLWPLRSYSPRCSQSTWDPRYIELVIV